MDFLQFSFEGPRNDAESSKTTRWEFSARFRSARNLAGLKRGLIARLLGVNVATICRWEAGLREPGTTMMSNIYRLLGDSVLPDLRHLGVAGQMKLARFKAGLSQEEAAKAIRKTLHWWVSRELRRSPCTTEDLELIHHFESWAQNRTLS